MFFDYSTMLLIVLSLDQLMSLTDQFCLNICKLCVLQIFDGPSYVYPSFGKQCGSLIPQPVESSDNNMFVKFASDPATRGNGFRAQYLTRKS